jgi:hypothetical protein
MTQMGFGGRLAKGRPGSTGFHGGTGSARAPATAEESRTGARSRRYSNCTAHHRRMGARAFGIWQLASGVVSPQRAAAAEVRAAPHST